MMSTERLCKRTRLLGTCLFAWDIQTFNNRHRYEESYVSSVIGDSRNHDSEMDGVSRGINIIPSMHWTRADGRSGDLLALARPICSSFEDVRGKQTTTRTQCKRTKREDNDLRIRSIRGREKSGNELQGATKITIKATIPTASCLPWSWFEAVDDIRISKRATGWNVSLPCGEFRNVTTSLGFRTAASSRRRGSTKRNREKRRGEEEKKKEEVKGGYRTIRHQHQNKHLLQSLKIVERTKLGPRYYPSLRRSGWVLSDPGHLTLHWCCGGNLVIDSIAVTRPFADSYSHFYVYSIHSRIFLT
ncbi:hypothetical protein TWF225_004168 [Orbilia oligospora]|nr:hypothetical protein TWF225_004168 [Orbilia oligospora]KAF3267204.1 hypothetical protein TWF128_010144 [Orbilia oligospora]KAF3272759.1 hypothetical protein TWF217_000224 [Orbilia oligospora]